MSHENHRFNLILRNQNHPTSGTKAGLNPIFSEASHGTHYSLFAEFLPKDPEKSYTDEYEVGSIRVKLMNYTGAITMGISSVIGVNIYKAENEKKDFLITNFSTKRIVELVVSVQPLNSCNEKTIILDDSESLLLKEGDLFETKVMHKLIDGSLSGTSRSSLNKKNLILDEKYMSRDGEAIILEADIWEDKSTIDMLEGVGFIINDKINKTLTSNNKELNKELLTKSAKELIDFALTSNKSRRNDPACKQKTSDIYII